MKHCPYEGCKNSIGGVDCRLNVENECKAGGGYEAWEPMPTAQLKPSRSEHSSSGQSFSSGLLILR